MVDGGWGLRESEALGHKCTPLCVVLPTMSHRRCAPVVLQHSGPSTTASAAASVGQASGPPGRRRSSQQVAPARLVQVLPVATPDGGPCSPAAASGW
jgi:hypothetical protein